MRLRLHCKLNGGSELQGAIEKVKLVITAIQRKTGRKRSVINSVRITAG